MDSGLLLDAGEYEGIYRGDTIADACITLFIPRLYLGIEMHAVGNYAVRMAPSSASR